MQKSLQWIFYAGRGVSLKREVKGYRCGKGRRRDVNKRTAKYGWINEREKRSEVPGLDFGLRICIERNSARNASTIYLANAIWSLLFRVDDGRFSVSWQDYVYR